MGPLDIWMILAGWLGLLLPLPSLWWAWHSGRMRLAVELAMIGLIE